MYLLQERFLSSPRVLPQARLLKPTTIRLHLARCVSPQQCTGRTYSEGSAGPARGWLKMETQRDARPRQRLQNV